MAKSNSKHARKWICIILGTAMVLVFLYFATAFLGNPISWSIARINSSRFMEENFGDSHFRLHNVGYDLKSGGYIAFIDSPTSRDSYFQVYFDSWGRYRYDTYGNIANGNNTYTRLNSDYWNLTEKVLDEMPFAVSISFGELRADNYYEVFSYTDENGERQTYTLYKDYGIDRESLVLDADYDLSQLGRDYGSLCLYIHDPEVSVERASELLLEVKAYLDYRQISFHAIDFTLCEPLNEQGQLTGDSITLYDFLYTDIYEEGLTQRVREHWDIAETHHEIQDREKGLDTVS